MSGIKDTVTSVAQSCTNIVLDQIDFKKIVSDINARFDDHKRSIENISNDTSRQKKKIKVLHERVDSMQSSLIKLQETMPLKIDHVDKHLGYVHNELSKEINNRCGKLDQKIDHVYEKLDQKIDTAHKELDMKITMLDQKIDTVHKELDMKITMLDQKIDTVHKELDMKITVLDQKITMLDKKTDNILDQLGAIFRKLESMQPM